MLPASPPSSVSDTNTTASTLEQPVLLHPSTRLEIDPRAPERHNSDSTLHHGDVAMPPPAGQEESDAPTTTTNLLPLCESQAVDVDAMNLNLEQPPAIDTQSTSTRSTAAERSGLP